MVNLRHLLLFLPSMAVTCWMGMMFVHECGHMIAAIASGGEIAHVVFHPLAFSLTDIQPNPHPLFVCWAGPVFGSLLPLSLVLLMRAARCRSFVAELFCAFCLLANAVYIGLGAFDRVGDAGDLLRLNAPAWSLGLFSLSAAPAGLLILHSQGPGFGIPGRISSRDLWMAPLLACVLILAGLCIDGR